MDAKLALRPREAAKAIGVSTRTLWTWTTAGRVPHVRIGRAVLYPVEGLRRWLEAEAARTAQTGDEPTGGQAHDHG